MRWNYLSILKLQRCCWSLEIDKYFHPTLHNGCNYLSLLGLKLIYVSKSAPLKDIDWIYGSRINQVKLYILQFCPGSDLIFSCDQAALRTFLSVHPPSVRPSVCLSVTPFSLCSHHRIIMKFSGVITNDRNDVHAKVKVTCQRSRSQRAKPSWAFSGP